MHTLAHAFTSALAHALARIQGYPHDSKRIEQLKARVAQSTQRHTPACIALLLNGLLIWMLATWRSAPYRAKGIPTGEINLFISDQDGFFTELNDGGQPPASGGGGQTAPPPKLVTPAAPQTLSLPKIDNLAEPITAPKIEQPPTLPTAALIAQHLKDGIASDAITSATTGNNAAGGQQAVAHGQGKGNGQGDGQGSGQGQGKGGGQGGGIFAGFTTGGNGQGGTNKRGRPGSITTLRNMDLVVLVDFSNVKGNGGGYLEKIINARPSGIFIKINCSLLPNILAQNNRILEARTACGDEITYYSKLDNPKAFEFNDLEDAILTIAHRYKNRPNTAIVIGSEFQFTSKDSTPEKRKRMEAFLLDLNIPIFFISLGAEPDPWFVRIARKTGGNYLGMIHAQKAKSLAKNEETVWPLVVKPRDPNDPYGPEIAYYQPTADTNK